MRRGGGRGTPRGAGSTAGGELGGPAGAGGHGTAGSGARATAGAHVALARLERVDDALRDLLADLAAVQDLVRGDGAHDPQLSTVQEQLTSARHKLTLYVQRFRRERAAELRPATRGPG